MAIGIWTLSSATTLRTRSSSISMTGKRIFA
jgi:hypothetical protein